MRSAVVSAELAGSLRSRHVARTTFGGFLELVVCAPGGVWWCFEMKEGRYRAQKNTPRQRPKKDTLFFSSPTHTENPLR